MSEVGFGKIVACYSLYASTVSERCTGLGSSVFCAQKALLFAFTGWDLYWERRHTGQDLMNCAARFLSVRGLVGTHCICRQMFITLNSVGVVRTLVTA
jgi:hypothetical protein